MTNKKIINLLYLVVALLIANIAISAYFVFSFGKTDTTKTEKNQIDTSYQVDKETASNLAKNLISHYNAVDSDGLYSQFDDLAKIEMKKDSFINSLNKLHSLVGNVDEYVYFNTQSLGNKNGKEFYALLYKVRLSSGPMPTGEMKITVAKDGEKLSVFSFFISALQQ